MEDDPKIRDEKTSRPLDNASRGIVLVCSLALGVLGFAIIAIGIVAAFQH
jgi:hypothetical protein